MTKIDSVYDISDRAKVELKAWLEPWFRSDGGEIEWEDVGTGGGGTGGSSGHIIEDEGVPLTQRKYLDFVGEGVTATDDAGNNKTIVTIPGGGFFGIPDQSVGYWYTCPFTKPGSSATPLNGVLHATPFIVTRTTTYDRIGVICSSAQTGSAYRFGIYTNSNGYPAALVLDAGTVATTSTGERSITISQQLTAGFYWLVAASQTSGSSATVSGGVIPYLFSTSTSLATADASGNGGGGGARVLTGVTGALPDPFTASAAWIGTGSAVTPFLRVASVP